LSDDLKVILQLIWIVDLSCKIDLKVAKSCFAIDGLGRVVMLKSKATARWLLTFSD